MKRAQPRRPARRRLFGPPGQGARAAEAPFFAPGPGHAAALESEAERTAQRVADGGAAGPLSRATGPETPATGAERTAQAATASGGRKLSGEEAAFFEPRFGRDLSDLRVHEGGAAGAAARGLGDARGFATGRDIALAPGAYSPGTREGRRLLGHEIAHTVQQDGGPARVQRDGPPTIEREPITPADLPEDGRYHVVIVGAPGPNEVAAGHTDQFIRAAERHTGMPGATVVWLVERTGYDLAGMSEASIRARAPGPVFFVDTTQRLDIQINRFPGGSITGLDAYSHGVPGLMALRYGWSGRANYGLSTAQARSLSPDAFAPDAQLSFDSCNSGTDSDDGRLAQEVADATQRVTEGWTGRTSYRLANSEPLAEDREVVASEISPPGGSFDSTELLSQLRGRSPREVQFAPRQSPGSFRSTFSMTARLPESRKFPVEQGGSVRIVITPTSEIVRLAGWAFHVILWREVSNWFDEDNGGSRRVDIGETSVLDWSNLDAGTYYIELYHLHGVRVEGPIRVDVRAP